ncbi:Uncharacterised protein [Mycobacterium tuberculosis]|nr:Uncharacterised protein [Mycobacterium tuberculosis]COX11107.1 Uncharacterised protein [Mycobacterium tuberculosis]COY70525.1 Uncharacterised protein [Mycobacterium tuberculosis]
MGTTGFQGFLMRPPANATKVPSPNAPMPTPKDSPISLRRRIVEPSNASVRFATTVLRSISREAPS